MHRGLGEEQDRLKRRDLSERSPHSMVRWLPQFFVYEDDTQLLRFYVRGGLPHSSRLLTKKRARGTNRAKNWRNTIERRKLLRGLTDGIPARETLRKPISWREQA